MAMIAQRFGHLVTPVRTSITLTVVIGTRLHTALERAEQDARTWERAGFHGWCYLDNERGARITF